LHINVDFVEEFSVLIMIFTCVCFTFQIFVSSSYDATTHFETTCDNVLDIYERMMGEKFDFSKVQKKLEDDQQ
uniref:GB1/RHD3-type G domain-containing protein n=1 Tax=Hymenolepis diminuta TaxID=6216 RepID=A0A0R3SNB4_HYMDI